MPEYKPFEFSRVWISGDFMAAGFEPDGTSLRFAVVREGLSRLTETEIMVFSETEDVDLSKLVGRRTCIHLKTEGDKERMFSGICISAEYSGFKSGHHVYIMHLRPWLWLLTLAEDCRIFQQKSAVEIIKDVLKQHGFSDIDDKLKDTYEKRDYCVQYRETDYAFLCRLMEEEGIYFRFSNADGSTTAEDLVLCDGISAHDTIPGHPDVGFHRLGEAPIDYEDHVSDWARVDNLTTGKVSKASYPAADT